MTTPKVHNQYLDPFSKMNNNPQHSSSIESGIIFDNVQNKTSYFGFKMSQSDIKLS